MAMEIDFSYMMSTLNIWWWHLIFFFKYCN